MKLEDFCHSIQLGVGRISVSITEALPNMELVYYHIPLLVLIQLAKLVVQSRVLWDAGKVSIDVELPNRDQVEDCILPKLDFSMIRSSRF